MYAGRCDYDAVFRFLKERYYTGWIAVTHEEWLPEPPEWMGDDTRERFAALYSIQKDAGLSLAELGGRFLLADPDSRR